eukprot:353222-Chlamydomonas_euryale.AAC.21
MVLTGIAAHQYAGPGVVLSYTFAPIAAIITAFSYSEFAAEYPIAGGAFNYISLSFGEYIGWYALCRSFGLGTGFVAWTRIGSDTHSSSSSSSRNGLGGGVGETGVQLAIAATLRTLHARCMAFTWKQKAGRSVRAALPSHPQGSFRQKQSL